MTIETEYTTGWKSCAGKRNQIKGKPCAICGYMTHTRGRSITAQRLGIKLKAKDKR